MLGVLKTKERDLEAEPESLQIDVRLQSRPGFVNSSSDGFSSVYQAQSASVYFLGQAIKLV